jgi:hypothetical protein
MVQLQQELVVAVVVDTQQEVLAVLAVAVMVAQMWAVFLQLQEQQTQVAVVVVGLHQQLVLVALVL